MRFLQIILQLKLKELEEQQKIFLGKSLKGGVNDQAVFRQSLKATIPESWAMGVEAMQLALKVQVKSIPFPAALTEYIGDRVGEGMKRAVMVYNARVIGLGKGPVVDQAFAEYKRAMWQTVRCAIQDAAQYGGRWASGSKTI